jgi:hypothetical protein
MRSICVDVRNRISDIFQRLENLCVPRHDALQGSIYCVVIRQDGSILIGNEHPANRDVHQRIDAHIAELAAALLDQLCHFITETYRESFHSGIMIPFRFAKGNPLEGGNWETTVGTWRGGTLRRGRRFERAEFRLIGGWIDAVAF